MSVGYKSVTWTRAKLVYDAVLIIAVSCFLLGFQAMALRAGKTGTVTEEGSLAIRTFGEGAFVLMTFALAIGPLARLDRRFLPLLYNRRHLGIVTFAVAAAHAWATFDWYFAFSPLDPWLAMLVSDASFGSVRNFPFVPFGTAAFLILCVLAATSHDFWLKFIGRNVWKRMHMAIYVAYTLVIAHLAFGPLQSAQGIALPGLVTGAAVALLGLHLAAGLKDAAARRAASRDPAEAGWIRIGAAQDIPAGRGITVRAPTGVAVAVFNDGGRFSALANRCAHQNGPLAEGRVIDGCVICPWHGYEYRLKDGCAPAPFTERVETYPLRNVEGILWVDPRPNALGTLVEAITTEGATS